MRLLPLYLCCLLGLTSCVNYGGAHSNTKPLTIADLAKPTTLRAPTAQENWWDRFQDPQLDQIITTALADSPDMQMAEARVRKAQATSQGAESALLPSVDLSGSLTKERFPKYGLIPPPFNGKIYNIGELGLNFNYEFDFWGKNREALKADISNTYATQADLVEARLVIATAVANAYFQLQNNIAQTKIANQIFAERQSMLAIIQDRAKHGVDSDIPVKTAIADAQAAQLIAAEHQQTEALAYHQLAALMGQNPLTMELDLQPFAYPKKQLQLPKVIPANVLAQRPDIAASRLRAEAAAHKINISKARFFPNLNLAALFSYQSILLNRLFQANSQNNLVSAAIDLPIFDAGARRADLSAKYADYDLAVTTYNQTLLTALREVADQVSTLRALHSQLRAQDIALSATQKNYQLARARYRHGIVDYIQVLEMKDALLQQEAAQLNYQYRHLQAVTAMIKALGGEYISQKEQT